MHRLMGLLALVLVTWATTAALADEPAAAPADGWRPAALSIAPGEFTLNGRRARLQLLATGTSADGHVRDLTHLVAWESSDPQVVAVENGVARPVADGTAKVTARFEGIANSPSAAITVTGTSRPDPVSFHNETLAALTKAGCNQGACHGSPSGKGGFRLSLRAFDPVLDRETLRQEFFGRRINRMEPAASLILRKPLMEVAHGGGQRVHKGDAVYTVLHDWIAEGLQTDGGGEPDLTRITVQPSERVFQAGADRQQLQVHGHFADGSIRGLTALACFSSSNEAVAMVGEDGVVEKTGRGETAVLVRYLGRMATSSLTFLEDVPGFAWNNPPESNFVDAHVFAKLKKLQILPSELCTDAEFLRRAYLDVTGRLPNIAETKAFLADPSEDRRIRLIDRLLETPEFAEFWALKWADVLRANEKTLQPAGVHKFHRWLCSQVEADRPLDEFARELLTAQGSAFVNPAANYWRASRDPLDAAETTAQLFLGIRIQCAKCHNHPFERWSQDNYYGLAAAFGRVGRKNGPREGEEVIFVQPSGEVTQPRTGQTMKVHLLLKGEVDVPADVDRREVFADWLTAPDNPFFARAAVNRIWGHLLGRGLVDPVDDFRESNPPSNAALLDEMAKRFVENGYSRKWAIRAVMTSRTYQLSARTNEFNAHDELYHSHAMTRLLTAEQLLDAICKVTDVPESFAGLPPGTRTVALPSPPKNHEFLKVFGQPQREMACQCERSDDSNLSQALQMINGPLVHGKLKSDAGRVAKLIAAGQNDDEIITELYLAAVCRQPLPEELETARHHIAAGKDRRQSLEDVAWAVLNSKEFLFQH